MITPAIIIPNRLGKRINLQIQPSNSPDIRMIAILNSIIILLLILINKKADNFRATKETQKSSALKAVLA